MEELSSAKKPKVLWVILMFSCFKAIISNDLMTALSYVNFD